MPRVFVPPKKKGKSKAKDILPGDAPPGFLDIDPERLRFQHSKIRTHFSGCGRSVMETLESIREGTLSPHDLPPIQVIVGPDENDGKGPWYFTLNNRRAWVLKRCREENLLKHNLIRVRFRKPKTPAEAARYTLENCATDAKFMKIQVTSEEENKNTDENIKSKSSTANDEIEHPKKEDKGDEPEDVSDESSSEDDEVSTKVYKNPFSVVHPSYSSDDSDDD